MDDLIPDKLLSQLPKEYRRNILRKAKGMNAKDRRQLASVLAKIIQEDLSGRRRQGEALKHMESLIVGTEHDLRAAEQREVGAKEERERTRELSAISSKLADA